MKKLILILLIATFAAWVGPAAAYESGGVDIHGFISQGFLVSDEYNYLAHNSTDGSFEYNEMGINFSKQLTDKLRVGMQLFSRDLGDAANNKITLDWAYGDYRFKDWLGLRAGRIKLPIGLYNDIRDVDMLRTNIVLPQGIYNDLLRDNLISINGLSFYGNIEMGFAGDLEYQLLGGAINSDFTSGTGKYTDSQLMPFGEVSGNASSDTSYSGMLRWETPLPGFKLGYSYFEGETDLPLSLDLYYLQPGAVPMPGLAMLPGNILGSSEIQVASAEYTWGNLTLVAEYMNRDNEGTVAIQGTDVMEQRNTAESYYVSAAYRFTDWFVLGAYYSEYYPDKDDKDGEKLAIDHAAWQKDTALTLRFDINEYWIVKLEGHAVDGTAGVLAIDNQDNDFSESNWYYGAAKVTFNF